MGIISDVIGANGARKAANAQKAGIENAKKDINSGYDKAIGYQTPFIDAGKQTIGQLATGLQDGGEFNRKYSISDFTADPGYAFRMQQGQQAVERGAAARGGALSGAAIKDTQRFGQDLASNEYQSAFNRYNTDLNGRFSRLSSVAQMGQRGADNGSNLEADRGARLGDLSVNKGNVNSAKELAYAKAGSNVADKATSYFGF